MFIFFSSLQPPNQNQFPYSVPLLKELIGTQEKGVRDAWLSTSLGWQSQRPRLASFVCVSTHLLTFGCFGWYKLFPSLGWFLVKTNTSGKITIFPLGSRVAGRLFLRLGIDFLLWLNKNMYTLALPKAVTCCQPAYLSQKLLTLGNEL